MFVALKVMYVLIKEVKKEIQQNYSIAKMVDIIEVTGCSFTNDFKHEQAYFVISSSFKECKHSHTTCLVLRH